MSDVRSLVIEKGPQGYGFNLSRLGTVHFLRLIEPGGAAERAGAQPGDRILTVNGQDVTIVSHADLVALIKTAGSKLRMTVRDLTLEEIASLKSEGDGKGAASPASAAAGGGDRKPASLATASRGATKVPLTKMEPGWTTVKLAKSPAGLGCNVSRVAQRHLFRVVAAGGAADKAGIKAGDEIIMVDGTDVRDMEHGELINLMKAGGDALELVIKPSSGQTVFMERVTGETNAQRLAKAQQTAEENVAEQMKKVEEEQKKQQELRRRMIFEEERTRLEGELDKANKNAKVSATSASFSRNEAAAVATPRELKDMDQVLANLAEQARKDVQVKLSRPLPSDPQEEELEKLRRNIEKVVVDDEIAQVQKLEWDRFQKDCKKRRAEEAKEDEEMNRKLKDSRQKDLEILQEKQQRMAALMAEAERRREQEMEEARRQREAEAAKRNREMQERLAKAQAAAQAREEAIKRQRQEEELRRKREEEERLAREFEEAEAKRKAAQRAAVGKTAEQEEAEAMAESSQRVALRKTAPVASKSHPMVALMAKQRQTGGVRIPLSKEMSDTRL